MLNQGHPNKLNKKKLNCLPQEDEWSDYGDDDVSLSKCNLVLDMAEAAALACSGFTRAVFFDEGGGKTKNSDYAFYPYDDVEAARRLYKDRKLTVDARSFYETLLELEVEKWSNWTI